MKSTFNSPQLRSFQLAILEGIVSLGEALQVQRIVLRHTRPPDSERWRNMSFGLEDQPGDRRRRRTRSSRHGPFVGGATRRDLGVQEPHHHSHFFPVDNQAGHHNHLYHVHGNLSLCHGHSHLYHIHDHRYPNFHHFYKIYLLHSRIQPRVSPGLWAKEADTCAKK
ncbi:hypothetical protein BHE74_00042766 [Ensete ventricosum]|nr:hypothetical protein BHE74_00042766 [Ensete ventricosum]